MKEEYRLDDNDRPPPLASLKDLDDRQPLLKPASSSSPITFKYMLWLFCVCFSLAGVQFIYSIQFALGTPLFNQKFKLTPSTITILQSTAGPISGFIIQPIIGVYSDNSTSRWGRRRPYILFGAICSIIGLLSIAFSPDIGKLLGDNENGTTPHDFKAGIIVAIIGFWIMNLAVNIMQGPTRSLVSDIVDADKQHVGNSMAVNTMGFASIAANIIGAQFSTVHDSYRDIFVIGAIFTTLSVIPTLIAAKEKQMDPSMVENISSPIIVFKKIGTAFATMNRQLIIISIVFFVSWFGFSPYMVSNTNWFGTNVSPNDYQRGVQLGFYATACFSAVSFLFSFFLPFTVKVFGERAVYSFSQLTAGAAFLLYLAYDRPPLYIAFILTSVVGINFTTFNSIPYALLVEQIPKNQAGMYMGVLNSSAVVSQTISILTSGQVEAWKHQDSAWAIAYGGLFSILGAGLAWMLPKRKNVILDIQTGDI